MMDTNDTIRTATPGIVNRTIDTQIKHNLNRYYNDPASIDERLQQLEYEWDIERALQLNTASLSLVGLLLAVTGNKKGFLLSLIVTGFLAQQAVKGWSPPVNLLRRFGMRTRAEIDKEKYALKAIRGDFKYLLDVPNVVWNAVNK
jgi:hypothetical protein